MDYPGIAGVTGITVICYLCGLAVKLSPWDNKYIPLLCGLCGGALGALSLSLMAAFPAENVIDAVAVGIASGLAATGADQLFRQLGQ
jgi:ABC-type uncharacterized transport system permease subunit